jgi:diguanylate cyclase (GGDEF)-like protein
MSAEQANQAGMQITPEAQSAEPVFPERRSGRDRRRGGRRASDVLLDGSLDVLAEEDFVDDLTGLCSEAAWKRYLDKEDERCGRYGHTSCVFSVDLDGPAAANQRVICAAGHSIRAVIKERDVVARVGTAKFAVLVAECNIANSRRVLQRIRNVLNGIGVTASLGLAVRLAEKGLHYAWREADRARHYRVP